NTNIWSPTKLMENYVGPRDYDTYTKYTDGIIIVHHLVAKSRQPLVDENNKQIPDQILLGKEGDLIDKSKIDIFKNSGYLLKDIENLPEGGKFTKGTQTINALYTTINGNVTVQYRDKNNNNKPLVDQDGKQIPDKQLKGRVSTPWTIGAPYFKGYAFVNATDSKGNTGITSGKYTADSQTITLNYTSEAKPATIKYQDESGKLIAEDEEINGKIDEQKVVKPKKITGYTIKSIFINDVKQDSTEQATFTLNDSKHPQTI
ncbi:MAG: MucBP domain-containing protein, partial [Lactobacillus sp.]|nr:MucBP domain-containing protein [Lactobacillus sp.]